MIQSFKNITINNPKIGPLLTDNNKMDTTTLTTTTTSDEKNKHQQTQITSPSRAINSLPLNKSNDYSPYFGLEFDLNVQDYCRNRNNYSIHSNDNNNNKNETKNIKNKLSSYNPLQGCTLNSTSKVVRSCKVVVSGDVAVGKTCLVNRFGQDIYSSNYQTTIGVDFDLQRFTVLGQHYLLQIWDTAGLERFRCITNSYYRGCQAALLVFDVSNMSTLANVLRWKDEVLSSSKTFEQLAEEHNNNNSSSTTTTSDLKPTTIQASPANDPDSPLLFLVGTKSDLPLTESSRSFIKEQANKVASILQAELWFVSARTGENVTELFNRVAALSFQRCILSEINRMKFETSTLGACLKEKILQQQKELWHQSSKLIKITRRKDGDDKRTRCVNIQCVIK